jgi:hypothetical protein
MMNRKVK